MSLVPFGLAKHLITLDFETYYDDEYSLRKLHTLEYIRDPRFEIILVALRIDDQEPIEVWDPRKLAFIFSSLPWEDAAVVGHHLNFDGGILVDKFGINPKLWIDTLSMARAEVKPFTGTASLEATAAFLSDRYPDRFPARLQKGKEVEKAKGLRRSQMSREFLEQYAAYSGNDRDITLAAMQCLAPAFSEDESKLIDRTVRMHVNPAMKLDTATLHLHRMEIALRKNRLLDAAGTEKADLMSNEKFAGMLRAHGITPPMKISPQTNKATYAFSKKDEGFIALYNHPDPTVVALVEARLGVKSTIGDTRAARLIGIAEKLGVLPAPLKYCGAGTTRYSGADKINLQNLPHGSPIRHAIVPQDGHLFVVADASQIEARIMATLMGQWDKVTQFRNKEDVYSHTATGLFGFVVTKETHPVERQIGKVADLQLQYLAGPGGFYNFCIANSVPIKGEEHAKEIVATWRKNNRAIINGGYALTADFKSVAASRVNVHQLHRSGWFYLGKDIASNNAAYIEFHNGLRIWYPEVSTATDKWGNRGLGYMVRKGPTQSKQWFQLFTPQLVANNTIQGLARTITMAHAVRLTDYPVANMVLTVHDELVFHVRKAYAERVKKAALLVMRTAPTWAPGIPLDAEVKIGASYGEAKS